MIRQVHRERDVDHPLFVINRFQIVIFFVVYRVVVGVFTVIILSDADHVVIEAPWFVGLDGEKSAISVI